MKVTYDKTGTGSITVQNNFNIYESSLEYIIRIL